MKNTILNSKQNHTHEKNCTKRVARTLNFSEKSVCQNQNGFTTLSSSFMTLAILLSEDRAFLFLARNTEVSAAFPRFIRTWSSLDYAMTIRDRYYTKTCLLTPGPIERDYPRRHGRVNRRLSLITSWRARNTTLRYEIYRRASHSRDEPLATTHSSYDISKSCEPYSNHTNTARYFPWERQVNLHFVISAF